MSDMRWTRSPAFVVLFVLVDLAVVAFAWVLMHRDADPATSAGPAATSSPEATATADQVEGPLFLAASSRGGLVRVTRGSCDSREPTQARVWVAARFRSALSRVTVPDLQEALGVTMDDDRVEIVGADAECKVSGFVSTDDGHSWRKRDVPRDIWYLDTDTTLAAVHGPVSGGVSNIDCTPVSVTTVASGDRAFVACSDVNVLEVSSRKDVNPIVYIVTSPTGVAKPQPGRPLVLAALSSCGADLARITSQQDAKSVACLGNEGAPLGLAVSGDRIFAQVGFTLMLSANGGKSFSTYPK